MRAAGVTKVKKEPKHWTQNSRVQRQQKQVYLTLRGEVRKSSRKVGWGVRAASSKQQAARVKGRWRSESQAMFS